MTGFETYKLWLALKTHFTQKGYDYFKYNGTIRATYESYTRKKENVAVYDKLSTEYSDRELHDYFLANFVHGDRNGGVYGQNGLEIYMEWKVRFQSVLYLYTEQVQNLIDQLDRVEDFDSLFLIENGNNCKLLTSFYRHYVSVETFSILNQIIGFFPQFSNELNDTYRWPKWELICSKYEKFLDVDIQKYTTILMNTLNI